MKKKLTTIIPIIVFIIGLAIFLYPTIANYWNSFTQTRAIGQYAQAVDNLDDEEYEKMIEEAVEYNKAIAETGIRWKMSDAERETYEQTLNVGGSGMMSYIEIPKIGITLAVYHGTNDEVLTRSIGHIEGSSLPVDGESVHCILSGHRGLPSAKLFSELDEITDGDTFMIRTLNEVYTYEVDQIRVVEPSDLSELTLVKGKNYCTLVTCTPYGVNTHRLLVRGHLIETDDSREIMILAEALQIKTTYVALVIAVPVLILLTIVALAFRKKPHESDPAKLAKKLGADEGEKKRKKNKK
ncbi:MAG: class C sortase [Clostridia bacterium]|nr:class C sortase [Clostridia bacterium]